MPQRAIYFLLLLLVCASPLLRAHEPGLSTASILWKPTQIELVLTFAVGDMDSMFLLDTDADGKVSQAEFSYGKAKLAALGAEAVELSIDGQMLSGSEPTLRMDDLNNVEFIARYPARSGTNFVYRCPIFPKLPKGHRQLATAKDADGKTLGERLLKLDDDTLRIPPEEASTPRKQTFVGFLLLGIEHILTGYDHLLFLFALLLVTRQFMSAVKIITCFTIAHSITLAVATFDLLTIPSRIVEPLIAATIIYVAVENIVLRREPKARWLLTFFFGLIHGFGFAGVLRELGVGKESGVALPLFSFNLGVEIGQIAVAAILLPLIWKFSKSPTFVTRWVPAFSVVIALAGGFWLVQRVLGF